MLLERKMATGGRGASAFTFPTASGHAGELERVGSQLVPSPGWQIGQALALHLQLGRGRVCVQSAVLEMGICAARSRKRPAP